MDERVLGRTPYNSDRNDIFKAKIHLHSTNICKIQKMTKSGLHGRSMISLVRLLSRMQIIFREGQSSFDPPQFYLLV